MLCTDKQDKTHLQIANICYTTKIKLVLIIMIVIDTCFLHFPVDISKLLMGKFFHLFIKNFMNHYLFVKGFKGGVSRHVREGVGGRQ